MLDHQRKDLFERVKPGTPHHAEARKAMEQAFALADEARFLRNDIRVNSTISAAERQRRLTDLTEGPLAIRLEGIWEPFRPIAASLDTARQERRKVGAGYVPAEEAAAGDNLSLVQAAMYFAKRDLHGR